MSPGEYDLRAIAPRLPWRDLQGKRCLDVGSRDGFYAFEMERRGAAEVVSLDIDDASEVHLSGPRASWPSRERVQAELDAGHQAFALAHEALDSDVARMLRSVYDLDPTEVGRFDFAVIGTLLHHLRDPLHALASIAAVLDGQLLVNDAVIPGPSSFRRRPLLLLAPFRGIPFWLLANPAGLRAMLDATGYEVLAAGRPYRVPYGPGREPATLASAFERPLRLAGWRLALRRGGRTPGYSRSRLRSRAVPAPDLRAHGRSLAGIEGGAPSCGGGVPSTSQARPRARRDSIKACSRWPAPIPRSRRGTWLQGSLPSSP